MTTQKQLLANVQNALKSTGPKSLPGKTKASQNSHKHGLFSKNLLLQTEKRAELEKLREGIYLFLAPIGVVEELLAEKIINATWRLRRVTQIESDLFESEDSYGPPTSFAEFFKGTDGECLRTLSRYETTLERSLYKALHELQRLQAMRLGQPVLAPISLEINGL